MNTVKIKERYSCKNFNGLGLWLEVVESVADRFWHWSGLRQAKQHRHRHRGDGFLL